MPSAVALAKTVITGFGISVTHGTTDLDNVRAVAFNVRGEFTEQDLTTANNAAYRVGRAGNLADNGTVVVTKLSEPSVDDDIPTDNDEMTIVYDCLDGSTDTITVWCKLLSVTPSVLELDPADGVAVDVTFTVTNLNASFAETAITVSNA